VQPIRTNRIPKCFSVLFAGGQPLPAYGLCEPGRYDRAHARLMEHGRTVLPQDVRYEAAVEEPEAEVRKTIVHGGLDREDGCLALDRTKRLATSASTIAVRGAIDRHAVGRSHRHTNELEPVLEALEILVAHASDRSGLMAPAHA